MKKILLTGGAGFIGSNIASRLVEDERIGFVRVLDNLSTGHRRNIEHLFDHPKFEFVWGDITDFSSCLSACQGMDAVCHQAALGSVPRSIKAPITTNAANITGTLNVFTAAKDAGIKRIVYAASSSTYGDSKELPKREEITGKPISPYSVTKLVNELYASVFQSLYSMEFIGLRYFNVFGPRQDPNGAYAAVIPRFFTAVLNNQPPTIYGDGEQSRDFTYVDNAVQANLLALFVDDPDATGEVYNIACGERTTLNELYQSIREIANSDLQPIYSEGRPGDVRHSLADISKARNGIQYDPEIRVQEGLEKAALWYQTLNRHEAAS